jgi:hypothetical protein
LARGETGLTVGEQNIDAGKLGGHAGSAERRLTAKLLLLRGGRATADL